MQNGGHWMWKNEYNIIQHINRLSQTTGKERKVEIFK